MSKENRLSFDRELRAEHLRSKITWCNCRLDRLEQFIMSHMRSNDPDTGYISKCINEREDIKKKCKEYHDKLYG
jgi:hypothetical protein